MMVVAVVQTLPCFKDLIAVLFECFSIISLGYLSCRFKLISPEAKDLGSYLTTFALPMIIFLNIAQMEFQTINLSFLLCILIAKLFLFITVTLMTLTISYPTNWAYAGALSILATQSNDFALGYPLIKSLYGESKPEMLSYLSLMAPIQLLILNPLGIIMLEFHKSKSVEPPQPAPSDGTNNGDKTARANGRRTGSKRSGLCKACEASRAKSPRVSKIDSVRSGSATNSPVISALIYETGARRALDDLTAVKNLATSGGDGNLHFSHNRAPKYQQTEKSSHAPGRTLPANDPENPQSILDFKNNDTHSCPSPRDYQLKPSESSIEVVETLTPCTCNQPARSDANRNSMIKHVESNANRGQSAAINWRFLIALASNPLILASVVALLVNLTHGPQLPKFVTKTANTIAASFASPALFLVGASMYGRFELLLRNRNDLLLASVLVLTKELVLPNIMRTLATIILPGQVEPEELPYLVDFSYLYGLLPTAPTACIIAGQYGVLSNVVSISMLLSTLTSAPLMLTASAIITQSPSASRVESVIAQTMEVSSLLSMTLASVTIYAIWRYREKINYVNFMHITTKLRKDPAHVFLPLLAVTQIVIGVGGVVWYFADAHPDETSQNRSSTTDAPSLANALFDSMDENNSSLSAVITTDQDFLEPGVVPVYVDLKYWTVCTVHYIFSSCGLLMSKFVILSIVVIMFSNLFKGYDIAIRVSRFMISAYAVLGALTVIWLVVESGQLKCTPAEPSLPSQTRSSVIRILFNMTFLCTTAPLFALVFKSDNKLRQLSKQTQKRRKLEDNQPSDMEVSDPSLIGRPFVKSCVSLSSDTSSALTSNTNLDSSTNNNVVGVLLSDSCIETSRIDESQLEPTSDKHIQYPLSDSLPIVLENPMNPLEDRTINLRSSMFGPYGSTSLDQESLEDREDFRGVASRCRTCPIDEAVGASNTSGLANTFGSRPSSDESCRSMTANSLLIGQTKLGRFHKHSILIVFMLINSILSLTSMLQVLNQDKPYGTFRQIEITNIALDFGQGILTFLVYGMKDIFPMLRS